MSMSSAPTPKFTGSQIGPPILVLTVPEIRVAEELAQPQRFHTRDGVVIGRVGDIAITAYGGERYPILSQDFLGNYEVLGRAGTELVAQRIVHVRRAWEVLEDGASFDYGVGRGRVPVARGSWLFQSDDTDFATVHPDVKHAGHVEAGLEQGIESIDWRARCALWNKLLHALPPLLAVLALSAFVAPQVPGAPSWLPGGVVGFELLLLIGGACAAFVMRTRRWLLKACVQAAREIGGEFQAAAQLLGQQGSAHFPGVALWRAAQTPPQIPLPDEAPLMQTLKSAVAHRLRKLDDAVKSAHVWESTASLITLAAFFVVLCGNLYLFSCDHAYALGVEFLVISLPALVAAIHGFGLRRRTAERVAAMKSLACQFRFAQVRLFEHDLTPGPGRQAVLSVICRAIATYNQHELRLALESEAPLPV